MKIFFCLFYASFTLFVYPQSKQSIYINAKEQFNQSNYLSAKESFRSLLNDKDLMSYSLFYLALTSYHLKEKTKAKDLLEQLLSKFPNWKNKSEVWLWLGYLSFEDNQLDEAIKYTKLLSISKQNSLVSMFLYDFSISELTDLWKKYKLRSIALLLTKKIYENLNYSRYDTLLENIFDEHEFQKNEFASLKPFTKKDKYSIAVMLPFMYQSLDNPNTVIKNSIIYHLYQGMLTAKAELDSLGINISLYPYDTKKKLEVTENLLDKSNIIASDVIVGPIFSGPNQAMSVYSQEHKKIIINPLSSKKEVIQDNPYGFLFNSSYTTQGKVAATYAATVFDTSQSVFIFYENNKDKALATAYKSTIEENGFTVEKFSKLTIEKARDLQEVFSEQYEYVYDTSIPKEYFDSISQFSNRQIRSKILRDNQTGEILMDAEGNPMLQYYAIKFKIPTGRVGHILAATSNNILVNNLINIVEVRAKQDSIGLIGYNHWLNFSLISFDQLERLRILFISPTYYDTETANYHKFKDNIITFTGKKPDNYHVIGYELIFQLGHLLNKYGTSFTNGMYIESNMKGFLMEDRFYGRYHDNQNVPILQLNNLKLVNKNATNK